MKCSFEVDTVPLNFSNAQFYFCPLEPSVAVADYDAVMENPRGLQGVFGPDSQWPNEFMTFDENLASLVVHEAEFERRDAFAYSIFNSEKTYCLGSIYVDPCQLKEFDCEVYFWVRQSQQTLENALLDVIQAWLKSTWMFSKVVFPGRTVSWLEWKEKLVGTE
ncbi:hypothetical protein NI389_18590 (plasmid) [Pseudoalteromonas xiamenensis]|uniref:hypothetical protein n=1 Tax=Pseudoalteromonas xiamenensis TaxID=882626 RepID=UPI0027E41DCD|nr:hypothetical protein [Pseudoalteromonas xiamenensis]WMN61817.1 hypothetical protein NI389_18590 [Pseudoalteromonas xiamenensis]